MRKYLVLILLLSVAFCQSVIPVGEKTLIPDCSLTPDKYGFVELHAGAWYSVISNPPDETLYCYEVNVSAVVNGATYEMEQQLDCDYIKLVHLPVGTYTVNYSAIYPDLSTKNDSCSLVISSSQALNLVVYNLKSGDVFKPSATVSIQAVTSIAGLNVNSNIIASLMNGTASVKQITLAADELGTKVGSMLLNVSEGNYTIRISAVYGGLSEQKDFSIIVSSSQVQNVSASGLNIITIEPENIVYPENSNLALQVELQDENRAVVTGASVRASLYKDDNKTADTQLTASAWYYTGSQFVGEAGDYKIVYTATKGSSSATATVFFGVGNESATSKELNFTVKILNPTSSVYLRDSVINARVKVTREGVPVSNASVVLFFEGQEITMAYDRFGEYAASIGPLSEGSYELKAVATKDNLVAQSKVTFMISRHILNIDTISPYYNQEFELKKGDALKIKAIVLDEERDIVSGALVVAKIMEPDGKALQMQLFQDAVSGEYTSTLYLDELNGVYQVTIEASKIGFVPGTKDSQFSITFKKEQMQLFSQYVNVETLLTIILGVAIIILLAALLRAFF